MSTTAATLANVASSATSVNLFAASADPYAAVDVLGRTVFNDSTQVLYLKFGATASTTSYTVQIPAGGYYEFPHPIYAGQVTGIWASANGSARLTGW
jgi:hypothetical protein